MKKWIACTGLVALSATSLQAAGGTAADIAERKEAKWWNISASLRGFYDDNYTTSPNNELDSFGFEVGPSLSITPISTMQTHVEAGYDYRLKWFLDDTGVNGQDEDFSEHTHRFNATVDHSFTPTFSTRLNESFVVSQEPSIIEPDTIGGVLIRRTRRSDRDNIRNRAGIDFNAQLTELLGTRFGYQNTWYEYDQEGPGSFSALLDRIEHLASVDLRWQAWETTTPLIGYQFGYTDYTSDDTIFGAGSPTADYRNRVSHFVFVGVDQQLLGNVQASARVGAQFTDYPNAPSSGPFRVRDDNDVSPYADANVTWGYSPGSSLRLGIRHKRIATDLATVGGSPVLDQETTTLYGRISHQITGSLTGSINAQGQFGEFNGGQFDGDTENLYMIGLRMEYQINPFLSAQAGYNFDELDSDATAGGLQRSYDRNRYFIGLKASY